MLKMFRKYSSEVVNNDRGIGLITALFVIVVVAMFGLLIVRYARFGSIASVEDYFWSQALYSAQSAAQQSVLFNDGGGTGSFQLTRVNEVDVATSSIVDGVRATATKTIDGSTLERTIEIHLTL